MTITANNIKKIIDRGYVMSLLKRISQSFLNRSNSYTFYKNHYKTSLLNQEELQKCRTELEHQKQLNEELISYNNYLKDMNSQNNDLIKDNMSKIKELESSNLNANKELISLNTKNNELKQKNSKYNDEIFRMKKEKEDINSLLKFEIETIEKFMFELYELKNNSQKSIDNSATDLRNNDEKILEEIGKTRTLIKETLKPDYSHYKIDYIDNSEYENTIGKIEIKLSEDETLSINEIIEKLFWNRKELHKQKINYKKLKSRKGM